MALRAVMHFENGGWLISIAFYCDSFNTAAVALQLLLLKRKSIITTIIVCLVTFLSSQTLTNVALHVGN